MNFPQEKYLATISNFGSPSIVREIADCIAFGKLIRLEIPLSEISRLSEIIERLNLKVSISDNSFKIPTDKNMDIWASTIEDCSDKEPNAMRSIYLHPDNIVCYKAKNLDSKNDDLHLGLEFNYPQCCVEAYCKWQTDNEDIDPITTITNTIIFDGNIRVYDFPNPFSRYFGLGLYSHFPCSLTCENTKHVAENSLQNLQIHFPNIADKIIEMENALVIFHKVEGICVWTEFALRDNTILLNKQSFQGQGKLKELFDKIEEIKLSETELHLFKATRSTLSFKTNDCFIGAFRYLANAQKNTLLKTAASQPTNQSF